MLTAILSLGITKNAFNYPPIDTFNLYRFRLSKFLLYIYAIFITFAVITLRRKWKNLRDSFVRELKQHNSGTRTTFKRKSHYMWFNQLEFLKDLSTHKIKNELEVDTNVDDSNVVDTIIEETDYEFDEINGTSSNETIRIESDLKEEMGPEVEYVQNKSFIETGTKEMDSDKLFLLSLLEDFKRIPEKHKMHAKCEILNIINKTLKRSVPRGFTETYGHKYSNNYWRNYYSKRTSMETPRDPLDISSMAKKSGIYTENNINSDN